MLDAVVIVVGKMEIHIIQNQLLKSQIKNITQLAMDVIIEIFANLQIVWRTELLTVKNITYLNVLINLEHVLHIIDHVHHVAAPVGEVGHHINIHPVLHLAVQNVNHKQYITNKDRY